MKRKAFSILFALVLVLSFSLIPAAPVMAATINVPGDHSTIQAAINAAGSGDTISVAAGTYDEVGQIVIDKGLTIVGEDRATTIIKPTGNTGSSGDARGWFLVSSGIDFHLSNVTLDGDGYLIYQAIRHKGSGSIENVDFKEIRYNESGPTYAGVAVAAFGTGPVDISNCTFSGIGRVGVLYFALGGVSTFSGNVYSGKSDGDWLDYALDISAGAVVNVIGNTISDCRGVASVDGSASAGILVTTYYGAGTQATITGNDIYDNTDGIAVGYDGSDTSTVVAHNNNIVGNTSHGIDTTASSVDATNNWWGDCSGPGGVGPGSGDSVSANVDYDPWLGQQLCALKIDIAALDNDDFTKPKAADDQRQALLDKIDAVCDQYGDGAYRGSENKLERDVMKKLEKWIVSTSNGPLIDKVDAEIAILQGFLP